MRGFRIRETMTGYHEELGIFGSRKRFEFEVEWGLDDASELFGGFPMLFEVFGGHVSAEGLYEGQIDAGDFAINYPRGVIEYSLVFGKYYYVGQKSDIKLWNLPFSHTTCCGIIMDSEDKWVSISTTKFKLRTLPRMLASLRLV